ncbi:hypothetical protein IT415_01295 [bacterium]|nr:hypothetical protein [bacterium]
MNQRGWEDLVDLIDQKYTLSQHKKISEPLPDNPRLEQTRDTIWFDKAGESYKIDRITHPAVSGTKTHYAHRGAASRIEHTYDPEEMVSKVVFYKQVTGSGWVETSPEGLLG